MAELRVAEGEAFPAVCVVSGVPTGDAVRLRGRASPDWISGLMIFTIIGYLFAQMMASRPYDLVVPMSRTVSERYRRWPTITIVMVGAGLAAFALASATAQSYAGWFLVVVLVGLVIGVFNVGMNSVGVMLTREGTLMLTRVDDEFVRAVDERAERARAAARRERLA